MLLWKDQKQQQCGEEAGYGWVKAEGSGTRPLSVDDRTREDLKQGSSGNGYGREEANKNNRT